MRKYLLSHGEGLGVTSFLKKASFGLLLALASLSASAFTKEECNIAGVNMFYAQMLLNEDPALFAQTAKEVKATSAADLDWSEELKRFIVGLADTLKKGKDPKAVGQAVFDACVKIKNT